MEQSRSECTSRKQRRNSPARVAREDKSSSNGGALGGRWPAAPGDVACGNRATAVSPCACAGLTCSHGPSWDTGKRGPRLPLK
jgi:hypothetical protein